MRTSSPAITFDARKSRRRTALAIVLMGSTVLGGCTGLFNPYLDFRPKKGSESRSGAPVARTATITADDALSHATYIQNRYRDALGDRAVFRRITGTGLITLGATSLGLGIADVSSDAVLVTGLAGVTGFGIGGWLDIRSDQAAYIVGYNAIECAIGATTPLLHPADPHHWQRFLVAIDEVPTQVTEVRKAMAELRLAGQRVENDNDNVDDTLEGRLKNDREDALRIAEETLDATRQALSGARKLAAETNRAPLALYDAVQKIVGEVDQAIQQQQPDLAVAGQVIGGLAQAYTQFTAIPDNLRPSSDIETEASEAPVDPQTGSGAAEMAPVLAQMASDDLTAANQQLNQASANFDRLKNQLENEENRRAQLLEQLADLEPPPSGEDVPEDNAETQAIAPPDGQMRTLRSSIAASSNAISELQDALVSAARSLEAATEFQEIQVKMGLATLRSEQSSQYQFSEAIKKLQDSVSEVQASRQTLADMVNQVSEARPDEGLAACGVDADSLVTAVALSTTTLALNVDSAPSGTAIITGGIRPYFAQLADTIAEGITVIPPGYAGSSVTVRVDSEAKAGTYTVEVTDTRGVPMPLIVTVTEPEEEEEDTPPS